MHLHYQFYCYHPSIETVKLHRFYGLYTYFLACARKSFWQCKVAHTNMRLSRIYPSLTDSCNSCKQSPADHSHMCWVWPSLAAFWCEIFKMLSTAYNATVSPEPFMALFAVLMQPLPLKLLNWRLTRLPSHSRWVSLFNKLEKLRFPSMAPQTHLTTLLRLNLNL